MRVVPSEPSARNDDTFNYDRVLVYVRRPGLVRRFGTTDEHSQRHCKVQTAKLKVLESLRIWSTNLRNLRNLRLKSKQNRRLPGNPNDEVRMT